jgi:hypothetical protein
MVRREPEEIDIDSREEVSIDIDDQETEVNISPIVSLVVNVGSEHSSKTYIVEYDKDTKKLRRIKYIDNGRVAVRCRELRDMLVIVKRLGLKLQ